MLGQDDLKPNAEADDPRVAEIAGFGGAGLILSLILTLLLGRSINRRLTLLRRTALTLAEEQLPAVVARPWRWVAASNSPFSAPAPATASRRRGSTRTWLIARRSMTRLRRLVLNDAVSAPSCLLSEVCRARRAAASVWREPSRACHACSRESSAYRLSSA